jgi:hypothetical protein
LIDFYEIAESGKKDLESLYKRSRSNSKSNETKEFNPFEDIPNETNTPFLHYSSILDTKIPPPPANFQEQFYIEKLDFDRFDLKDLNFEDSVYSDLNKNISKPKDNEINASEFDENYLKQMNSNTDKTSTTKYENSPSKDISKDDMDSKFKNYLMWSSSNSDFSEMAN